MTICQNSVKSCQVIETFLYFYKKKFNFFSKLIMFKIRKISVYYTPYFLHQSWLDDFTCYVLSINHIFNPHYRIMILNRY